MFQAAVTAFSRIVQIFVTSFANTQIRVVWMPNVVSRLNCFEISAILVLDANAFTGRKMDLRLRVTVPAMTAAAVMLLGLALANQLSLSFMTITIALIGLGAIAALTWFVAEKNFQQPLERLTRGQTDLLRGSGMNVSVAQSNPVQRLEGLLSQAAEATAIHIDSLAQERETLKKMQQTLQESEERYELAVRGANDGLWEWDLKTNQMYLSPRWKGMLGYSEAEFPETADAWKERVFLDDLPSVEAALQDHLQGKTTRIESEHRVVHKDGSVRWVMSRAMAIRHANGSPYRVLGLDTETTNFKRIEAVLFHVARGTANATGEEFFRRMVEHFALALNVSAVWVTRCLGSPVTRMRSIACWYKGEFIDKEYALEPTPCYRVIKEGIPHFIPQELNLQFPKGHPPGMVSYLGIPIFNAQRQILGHIVFKDDKKMDESMLMYSVYQIFTERAGVEMERMKAQQDLLDLVHNDSELRADARLLKVVSLFEQGR